MAGKRKVPEDKAAVFEVIRRMKAERASVDQIAAAIGISKSATEKLIRAAGLSRPKRGVGTGSEPPSKNPERTVAETEPYNAVSGETARAPETVQSIQEKAYSIETVQTAQSKGTARTETVHSPETVQSGKTVQPRSHTVSESEAMGWVPKGWLGILALVSLAGLAIAMVQAILMGVEGAYRLVTGWLRDNFPFSGPWIIRGLVTFPAAYLVWRFLPAGWGFYTEDLRVRVREDFLGAVRGWWRRLWLRWGSIAGLIFLLGADYWTGWADRQGEDRPFLACAGTIFATRTPTPRPTDSPTPSAAATGSPTGPVSVSGTAAEAPLAVSTTTVPLAEFNVLWMVLPSSNAPDTVEAAQFRIEARAAVAIKIWKMRVLARDGRLATEFEGKELPAFETWEGEIARASSGEHLHGWKQATWELEVTKSDGTVVKLRGSLADAHVLN